jgi:predicted PurR-regulated permease PerM
MLGGVILVMQIEGHVLQPFLLGRAVKLHPLAVLISIAIGIIVAGIVGALMAVPLLAFTKSFVLYLAGTAEPPLGERVHLPAVRLPPMHLPAVRRKH